MLKELRPGQYNYLIEPPPPDPPRHQPVHITIELVPVRHGKPKVETNIFHVVGAVLMIVFVLWACFR